MGRRKKPENADLPRHVIRKGGRFYVTTHDESGRRQMHAAGATRAELAATMRRLGVSECYGSPNMPEGFPKDLWRSARTNAREKAVPFELTVKDVAAMIAETGGRCPIGGAEFDYARRTGERFRPWVPSLDRIDRAKGYVLGNCRIVSAYVNLAMNEFGEAVFLSIARYAGRRRRKIAESSAKPRSIAGTADSKRAPASH